MYAWTAILILPINSAINPILYTFLVYYDAIKKKLTREGQERVVETPEGMGGGRQSQKGRRKSRASKKSRSGREREGDELNEAVEMREKWIVMT